MDITLTHPTHGPVTVTSAERDRAGVLVWYTTPAGEPMNRDAGRWPAAAEAIANGTLPVTPRPGGRMDRAQVGR